MGRRASRWRPEVAYHGVAHEHWKGAHVPRPPVVFISSTSDLAAEREALASMLPPAYAPYLYERDRAGSRSPEDRCREMIEHSDVFVCLLGERFGSLYSFDVGPRSIVEWEFDTARERDHLELMTFQKEPLTNIEPGSFGRSRPRRAPSSATRPGSTPSSAGSSPSSATSGRFAGARQATDAG